MAKSRVIEITAAEYSERREEYMGLCLACLEWSYEVEPDARGYVCESCGASLVYGVEELLLEGMIEIIE